VKIVDLNNSQFEVAQVGDPIPSGIKTHLNNKRGDVKEDVRGDVKRKQKSKAKAPGHLCPQITTCLASRSVDVIFIL
jgi:hypothetical protein